jgi:hypothetical protein
MPRTGGTAGGFVKLARSLGGQLELHANVEGKPVAIYLNDSAHGLTRLELDTPAAAAPPVQLTDYLAVACVPEKASSFDGIKAMKADLFVATGGKLGAAIAFG